MAPSPRRRLPTTAAAPSSSSRHQQVLYRALLCCGLVTSLFFFYSVNHTLVFVTTFVFHQQPRAVVRPSQVSPQSSAAAPEEPAGKGEAGANLAGNSDANLFRPEHIAAHKAKLKSTAEYFQAVRGKTPWPKYPTRLVGKLVNASNEEVLCQLKRIPPVSLTRKVFPFNVNPVGKYFAEEEGILSGRSFKTCALVSSSGRMTRSRLGEAIDSMDQVLRMNGASVSNMESDVGNKTTMRMLNNFELYALNKVGRMRRTATPTEFPDSKDAVLIGWDACTDRRPFYTCLQNLGTENIRKDDQDTLQPFLEWRKKHPDKEFYFLDPVWVWDMGDFMQQLSPAPLETSVPSSGFLGFVFLLHYCEEVHLFEMIPSLRGQEKRPCHYYPHLRAEQPQDDTNCTFIRGHQRETEILTYMRLNIASDTDVYGRGHAVVPGLVNLVC